MLSLRKKNVQTLRTERFSSGTYRCVLSDAIFFFIIIIQAILCKETFVIDFKYRVSFINSSVDCR